MDWDTYKALCDQPDVWSRWMLEQTAELLSTDPRDDVRALTSVVLAALDATPLDKPAGHKGGDATDMFQLVLDPETVNVVRHAVADAADTGRTSSGTAGRGLGGFVEAWQELSWWNARGGSRLAGRKRRETEVAATERVAALIEAFNHKDLDAIVACFAADAVYHNIPMEPVHGPEGIRGALSAFLEVVNATFSRSVYGIEYERVDGVIRYDQPVVIGFRWILPSIGLRARF